MIFDSKLTWKYHINDIVQKCKQPINLMKTVARKQWGGDRKSLKLLYTSLVRSRIDYGSFLYATASDTNLYKVSKIQYEGIRIITGMLRSTPVIALEAEPMIPPLKFRREQLMLQYFTKILRIQDHPVTIAFNQFYNFEFYIIRPYALPVVGRAKVLISKAQLPIENMEVITRTNLCLM